MVPTAFTRFEVRYHCRLTQPVHGEGERDPYFVACCSFIALSQGRKHPDLRAVPSKRGVGLGGVPGIDMIPPANNFPVHA